MMRFSEAFIEGCFVTIFIGLGIHSCLCVPCRIAELVSALAIAEISWNSIVLVYGSDNTQPIILKMNFGCFCFLLICFCSHCVTRS